MNKMDFLIKGLWYSVVTIACFSAILIAAAGLVVTPMWLQYIIALTVGFGLAYKKIKKEGKND